MTAPSPTKPEAASASSRSSGGAVRLLVLVGILAIAVGAWLYDYLVAGPGSETKYDAIRKMADEINAKGIKEGGLVKSDNVSAVVGFAPTYVEQGKDYTIEWYCWWGKIPFLSKWKRYITVVYISEPRRYNAHYKNEAPPAEALMEYVPAATAPDATAASGGGAGAGQGSSAPPTGGIAAPPDGEPPARGANKAKPAESKPAEDSPAEAKPAESKPAEEKPAESKPAEGKPAETKPAEEKPAESKPAESKPAETKLTEPPAAGDKPNP